MEKLILTVDETKEALGIGTTKLYELLNADELETVKIGRATRVTRASIDRFIKRGGTKWELTP